ncbi:hypothetical protein QTN25_008761 [Entamoeba marina]
MELVKRLNSYHYLAASHVYFSKIDHCYYQFFNCQRNGLNQKRFETIEQCNSPYTHCYLSSSNENYLTVRFSLFCASTPISQFEKKQQLTSNDLCSIFLQLVEAISILHSQNTYHGNLSTKTVFIDENELTISLSYFLFDGLNTEKDIQVGINNDLSQIPNVILSLIYNETTLQSIVDGLKQNDSDILKDLSLKTSPLFVCYIHTFLNKSNGSKLKDIKKWIDLFEVINQDGAIIETLLKKNIEFKYEHNKTQNVSCSNYIHHIQPFIVDSLKYVTPLPVKHNKESLNYYIDKNCNIYDIVTPNLFNNAFSFTQDQDTTYLQFEMKSDTKKTFNCLLESKFQQTIHNDSLSLPCSIPKDQQNSDLFSQTITEITIICTNNAILLSFAISLRSLGYVVKCKKFSTEPIFPTPNSFCVTVLLNNCHSLSKPRLEADITVESINGKYNTTFNEFVNSLTNSHYKFHSMPALIWAKTVTLKSLSKMHQRKTLTISSSFRHSPVSSENKFRYFQRYKSCQSLLK